MGSDERDWREDKTCKRFVLPALDRAGWAEDQISNEYPITDGRILATVRFHERDSPLRAD